jgi:hypothetical protein
MKVEVVWVQATRTSRWSTEIVAPFVQPLPGSSYWRRTRKFGFVKLPLDQLRPHVSVRPPTAYVA